jgi:sec-independent protein translocase protein TatA
MKFNIIANLFSGQEILFILIIVLIFFGGKKVPELMRGLGKGVKEFRDATKDEPKEPPKKDGPVE